MTAELRTYAFTDRRDGEGLFPVFDVGENVVARIRTGFWSNRFTAYDAGGAVLCTGQPRPFVRAYDVMDDRDSPLLGMRTAFLSAKRREIELADGRQLALRSPGWGIRDWDVFDGDRQILHLGGAPWFTLHPDAYAVEVVDGDVDLAVVIGIVQANRMLVKQERRRRHSG